MTIIKINRKDKNIPFYYDNVLQNVHKIFDYLIKSNDENFIKSKKIIKIEIYDDVLVKIYLKNKELWTINIGSIVWLKTHHYIHSAKYYAEECYKFWDIVKKEIDMFVLEKWYSDNDYYLTKNMENVFYDRKFIYVNGSNTYIPFNYENLLFVIQNKQRWL